MIRQGVALALLFVVVGACGGHSSSSEGDDESVAGEAGEIGTGGAPNGGSASGGVSSGGVSSGGSSNGGVSGSGGSDPCAGRECGEACFYPCPSNAACDPVVNYCDPNGNCRPAFPNCDAECYSANDCRLLDVAVPCEQCPDGSLACASVECVRGTCVPVPGVCPECAQNADCPVLPLDCTTCANGNTSCPVLECFGGACSISWTGGCAGKTPCSDLACGAPCNPCNLPECPPQDVPHFCDAQGECAPEPLGCFGACKRPTDCPPPPPSCGDCPIDTCLAVACVDGTCEHVCR